MNEFDSAPPQKIISAQNYIAHGDLLEKIRPDEIIEVIKRRFMGEEFIDGLWVASPELKSRALTQRGAFDMATLMLSASSQNVSISNIKDRDIRERTRNIIRTAMAMCLRNWSEYGISGSDQFHFIKEIIHTNTFVTLKQPEGGGIQKLISGTHEVKLSESENAAPSIWDKVMRRA